MVLARRLVRKTVSENELISYAFEGKRSAPSAGHQNECVWPQVVAEESWALAEVSRYVVPVSSSGAEEEEEELEAAPVRYFQSDALSVWHVLGDAATLRALCGLSWRAGGESLLEQPPSGLRAAKRVAGQSASLRGLSVVSRGLARSFRVSLRESSRCSLKEEKKVTSANIRSRSLDRPHHMSSHSCVSQIPT